MKTKKQREAERKPSLLCGLAAGSRQTRIFCRRRTTASLKSCLPDAKQVLIDVISAAIEQTVVDVQVRNIELPVMDVDEKAQRFDVNCIIDNGELQPSPKSEGSRFAQVDVEMHSCPQEEIGQEFINFINKYIYYLTALHKSQKSKGKKYFELVRTYQITFCMNTVLTSWPDFTNRFSLRTHDGRQLSDQINMIIIELDKLGNVLKKPIEKMTALEKWSLFFKFAPNPLHRNQINDIIESKEEIRMAATLLQEVSKDERERALFRSLMMFETDRVSDLLTAEARGEIKGRAEIIALLKKGLSLEEIEKAILKR